MGYWGSKNGTIGDRPADIMVDAVRKIIKVYQKDLDRKPSKEELVDTVNFVSTVALEKE